MCFEDVSTCCGRGRKIVECSGEVGKENVRKRFVVTNRQASGPGLLPDFICFRAVRISSIVSGRSRSADSVGVIGGGLCLAKKSERKDARWGVDLWGCVGGRLYKLEK